MEHGDRGTRTELYAFKITAGLVGDLGSLFDISAQRASPSRALLDCLCVILTCPARLLQPIAA